MGEKTGKVKEAVGWATGDREVEAEGRVEQKPADPSEPVTEVNEEVMEDERQAVRRDHHVDDPEAPDADPEERN